MDELAAIAIYADKLPGLIGLTGGMTSHFASRSAGDLCCFNIVPLKG